MCWLNDATGAFGWHYIGSPLPEPSRHMMACSNCGVVYQWRLPWKAKGDDWL